MLIYLVCSNNYHLPVDRRLIKLPTESPVAPAIPTNYFFFICPASLIIPKNKQTNKKKEKQEYMICNKESSLPNMEKSVAHILQ